MKYTLNQLHGIHTYTSVKAGLYIIILYLPLIKHFMVLRNLQCHNYYKPVFTMNTIDT